MAGFNFIIAIATLKLYKSAEFSFHESLKTSVLIFILVKI